MAEANEVGRRHIELLKADAEEGSNVCYEKAKNWSKLYYGSRAGLILFSGLTSAQALLAIPYMTKFQAVFALLVTLITGFDVWLKPGAETKVGVGPIR